MSKKIVIESCRQCPHRDHRGAFGKTAYVPYCKLDKKDRDLPYTVSVQQEGVGAGKAYANLSDKIPNWCPLEDNKQ